MASCNSWQYLVTILAKIFPRSWQDLAKILPRYPWRVDPGNFGKQFVFKKIAKKSLNRIQKSENRTASKFHMGVFVRGN